MPRKVRGFVVGFTWLRGVPIIEKYPYPLGSFYLVVTRYVINVKRDDAF